MDCLDARALAEFYRQLLGLRYGAGDEPPTGDTPDLVGQDWLVLVLSLLEGVSATPGLGFQQVAALPRATWPDGEHPQMLHLDLTVSTVAELDRQQERATALGAQLLLDRSGDAEEPLRVYADPAGHPFCIFVAV